MAAPGLLHGASPASPPPAASENQDEGVFILSVAGQPVGTEKFNIRASKDKVEADAQIEFRVEREGKTYSFRTSPKLTLDGNLTPQTYTWQQKGSQSSRLEVDFRTAPVRVKYRTVGGDEDIRDFDLPRDVVVLDDNVIHHYQLVVDRYRRAGKGKQAFRAFIPQQALPGVVTVEEVGQETPGTAPDAPKLRHLMLTTDLARIDLWVDKKYRLQRVSIPTAMFEAVRKE